MRYHFFTSKKLFLSAGIVTGGILIFFVVSYMPTERNLRLPEVVAVGKDEDVKFYTLEWALTQEEQTLGLSGRDTLCEACAMAFHFGIKKKHAFWMGGMRFPLDIAWLSRDGVIIHIEHRISHESREVYRPGERAYWVFEFNAGTLDAVQKDDILHFSSFEFESPSS